MDEILKEKLALGRFHYVRREFARAEQYLTQVVEGNPTFADVYNMLGVCFHDQGHYQKAQRAFEAALRLNPAYTDAALNLAITYNDTGRYKEAQEVYQQALSTAGAAPGQLDHFVPRQARQHVRRHRRRLPVLRPLPRGHRRAAPRPRALPELRRHPGPPGRRAARLGPARRGHRRVRGGGPRRTRPSSPGASTSASRLYAAGRMPQAADQWNEVLRISPGNHSAELYLKFAGIDPDGAPPAAPQRQER